MQFTLPSNKIIGHRGAAAYAPENTFAAFNKALSLGCRHIEFDVMLSADGEPFVIHDESLKRTTNGRGEVGLVNAEYLESLDAGKWFSRRFCGEKIPHLSEVLKWLNFSNVNANIEIKPYPGTAQQTTVAVLSCINRYWSREQDLPLISSFNLDALQWCRDLAPEMPLGLLLHEWDKNWLNRAQELSCYSINLNRKIIKKERIQAIKAKGYVVLAYSINRKRQARKLLEMGVDALFSDYPDLLS